jgi:REP element-mobilizing transposase RayT
MARPLRLEFAGALYHVTARGNERRRIFLGDEDSDRAVFLDVLGATCERFNWVLHAYCLMTNHVGVSRMTVSRAVKRDENAAVTCET